MGKRAYAESLYGPFKALCDLECDAPEAVEGAEAVLNLQAGVRTLLVRGEDTQAFFAARLDSLRDSVLMGDEVGLLYQMLAREAGKVDRVWAGLASRLKG